MNPFGVFRVYTTLPEHDPEDEITLGDLCDSPNFGKSKTPHADPNTTTGGIALTTLTAQGSSYEPFDNPTQYYLMHYAYSSGDGKSGAEINRLVHEYILQPNFNPQDLEDFDFMREA